MSSGASADSTNGVPASSTPPHAAPSGGGDPSKKDADITETVVKVAGVALAVGIGISLLRNRKVQEKMEDVGDSVSDAASDADPSGNDKLSEAGDHLNSAKEEMKGSAGSLKESAESATEGVKGSAESAAKETQKKSTGFFGRAKKAANKVKTSHRGLVIQKGDTLWGLSRKYNVPVAVIKASNTIIGDKLIAGEELVIPGAGLLDDVSDD